VHRAKASSPIVRTDCPIVADANAVHTAHTCVPRLVTESGIVSEVKEEQWEKAAYPIVRTDCPIVTDANAAHPAHTCIPRLVTESGIVSEVKKEHW
jgi:hypothetical protein